MSDAEILAILYRNALPRLIPGVEVTQVIGHLSFKRAGDKIIQAWPQDKSWRITVVHSLHAEPRFLRKVQTGDPTDDLIWLKLRT